MPVIWLIDAYRAGERGQVRALVDALGWPYETKSLNYDKTVVLPHVLGRNSVRGLSLAGRLQIRPPWPDLIVSCGVRNEPVCRWIRDQSGGHTRYVHVGRPWGRLDSFDAVITTPQYRVPERSNVVQNLLTLHSVTRQRLLDAAEEHNAITAGLPAPYVAVIVGGDSGPYTLGAKAARRLGEQASELASSIGGSLLVTTSSRTAKAAVDSLRNAISVPSFFYPWRPDDKQNPYLGMLVKADRFIVTADSIAMISEACATGKPVQMFDIGGMREDQAVQRDFRLGGALYSAMQNHLWDRLSRDITLVHRELVQRGIANWLGDAPLPAIPPPLPENPDMVRALAKVRELLEQQ